MKYPEKENEGTYVRLGAHTVLATPDIIYQTECLSYLMREKHGNDTRRYHDKKHQ